MKESLYDAHKFKLWKKNLESHNLKVKGVEEIYTLHRHNGEVLFSLLKLDAAAPDGHKIPPICFLKGQVITLLICLIDKQSRERYILMVKQRRICNGNFIYETVAGMVDLDDNPLDVAIREAEEESGIRLAADQVHLLNEEPLYVSTGTSDEAMYFFYAEQEMEHEQIMSYHDNHLGMISEHEVIQTHIATIPEALKLTRNAITLLNIHLYLAARP